MDHYNNKKSKKNNRIPVSADIPESKNVRQDKDPDELYKCDIRWAFCNLDLDGNWPLPLGDKEKMRFIIKKLSEFEKMTCADIYIKSKKQNHGIEVAKLNKCAIKRLEELNIQEDIIHSLRLEGKVRLYGILKTPNLHILWYDPNHGDNDTCVCRSSK